MAGSHGCHGAGGGGRGSGRPRRSGSPRLAGVAVFAREAGMLLGLFALWTYAGSKSEVSLAEAMRRAAWIWHAERDAGLPSEQALQRLFLPHPLLVESLNWYYAVLHFPALIGCLVWLFVWHRGEYWRVRTVVLLFTAASLLVQFIPVVPPRLVPLTGMTDTGLAYGQSVYSAHAGIDADQLSAMPSNHFWLDAIAAAALLALAIVVQRAARPAYRVLTHGIARRPWPVPSARAVAGSVLAGAASAGAVLTGVAPAIAHARTSPEPRPATGDPRATARAHTRAAAPGRPGPRTAGGCPAVRAGPASRDRPGCRQAAGQGGRAT